MNRMLIVLAATGLLAACHGIDDPYERAGTWQPNHSNDANLRAMVANPGDLQRGRGDGSSMGDLAAAAVSRLRNDKVKALPDSGVSEVRTMSNGTSNGNGTSGGSQ